jgi:Flp pilus assembly protein TadG
VPRSRPGHHHRQQQDLLDVSIVMTQQRTITRPINTFIRDERGAIAVLLTVMLPAFVGFMTLSIDATYLYATNNQLQIAADAAALAGVQYVGAYENSMGSTPCASNSLQLCTSALALAGTTAKKYNQPITAGSAAILKNSDIVVGNWSTSGVFTPMTSTSTLLANAVQVTTRMSATTFFTPMLAIVATGAGFTSMSLTATATAAFTSTGVDTGGVSGSLVGGAAKLIIVQDISRSFSATCTYQGTQCMNYAQTAIQDCAEYFKLTGSSSSKFGLSELTGNSPQTGWKPTGWVTGNPSYTAPYYPLTAPTSSNWVTYPTINDTTTMSTTGTPSTTPVGCNTSGGAPSTWTTTPYVCSGSNVAAGMQAAINQLCQPSSSCGESVNTTSTMEMIIITDGDPNCSTYTSNIAGQNCGSGGNSQLLSDAQTLATTAGQNGISVSTIYYNDNSCTSGTCQTDLDQLTINSNAALNQYHQGSMQALNFAEQAASNLSADMVKLCAGVANGSKPRLVL